MNLHLIFFLKFFEKKIMKNILNIKKNFINNIKK